jgi:hypothetical protein
MHAGRLNWGLVFIIIGLFFLGWSTRYLPFDVIVRLVELWPVLLIAIGIQMIFSKSKAPQLAYLSSLLLLGAAIYAVTPYWGDIKYRTAERTSGTIEQSITQPVQALEIRADFSDRDFTLDDHEDENVGKLVVSGFGRNWLNVLKEIQDRELPIWKLSLSQVYPLDLYLRAEQSYCYLRMADLNIRSLDLDCEKCHEVVLQFGDKIPARAVMLDLRKSKVRLEIPRELDIMLKDGMSLPYYLTENLGFIERGDDLLSDSVVTNDSLLILDIGPGLRDLEINRY